MDKITSENFDSVYVDTIEQQQIDKFVCDEVARQIHRYIKGMRGTVKMMNLFEEKLRLLSVPEKEEAIARYIDLNRKAISGLDWKVVLARAMANYCDTFDYLVTLLKDKQKCNYYLQRIKGKYIRFHTIFEENNLFGIKDYEGKVIIPAKYNFLRTPYVYVDDLRSMPVIAEKDGKMGLVLPDGKGTVVADFIYSDIQLRDEPPYFDFIK